MPTHIKTRKTRQPANSLTCQLANSPTRNPPTRQPVNSPTRQPTNSLTRQPANSLTRQLANPATLDWTVSEVTYDCSLKNVTLETKISYFYSMNKEQVSELLLDYFKGYSVSKLGLFGSFRRGEERPESDIDVLILFNQPVGLLEFVGMQQELSELVGRKVDLVSDRAIKNEKLRRYIESDLELLYDAKG